MRLDQFDPRLSVLEASACKNTHTMTQQQLSNKDKLYLRMRSIPATITSIAAFLYNGTIWAANLSMKVMSGSANYNNSIRNYEAKTNNNLDESFAYALMLFMPGAAINDLIAAQMKYNARQAAKNFPERSFQITGS